MTDNAHLDRVAEAIWRATLPEDHPSYLAWDDAPAPLRNDYRRMAQAAMDALELAEETANRTILTYNDPPEPHHGDFLDGPVWATHYEWVPSTRLVTEWSPKRQHANTRRPWRVDGEGNHG